MCNLNRYIDSKMKMTAVYQPVILKSIIEGETRLDEIARKLSLLLHGDDNHICKYIKVLKVHPNKVLKSHGIAQIVPRSGQFTLLEGVEADSNSIDLLNEKINKFMSK